VPEHRRGRSAGFSVLRPAEEDFMGQPDAAPLPHPSHTPYVPATSNPPELTWPALLAGAVLGVVFGASSLYLVLKVGMTVSASIPVAVLSITLFRVLARFGLVRRATILENNIVQTTGSAGESIAFGVGVTIPALLLLGFEMTVGRALVVSVLGSLLGVLMMVPLRRVFMVQQHGKLIYPEGTACADVLIVGERGGASARVVFIGFMIAFAYQFMWQALKWWKEIPSRSLSWFKGAVPSIEVNPALLGVGYVIGTRIACIVFAGGLLGTFVLAPMIRLFGDGRPDPLYPGTVPISQMSEDAIAKTYVLYIGAGAVAAGGIISLVQILPLIAGSIRAAFRDVRRSRTPSAEGAAGPLRTERDLPFRFIGFGILGLVLAIWATSPLHEVFDWVPDLRMNPIGALLIVLFGFLFVTVSARLAGEIGSSSNPISGMTVATLLLTCMIFLALGWNHPEDRLTALTIAAVVCIAAANSGATAQDLKTGYLIGATPRWQQIGILVGSLTSALVIGGILVALNDASTVYTTKDLPRLASPLNVADLSETAHAPDDEAAYHVWRAAEGNPQGAPQGKYLVDDEGRLRYRVDPGINGTVSQRPDGVEVPKFNAPKARLMALITDGVLSQRLPWALVLLGVAIAVLLELSGVPALPFAVGVYLPISTSFPIFVGGLVRYFVGRAAAVRSNGATANDADSEMSPGMLLATGYIAGGAIAGVLIAFLTFSDEIPRRLSAWQYRSFTVPHEERVTEIYRGLALHELGADGLEAPPADKEDLLKLTTEIEKLNAEALVRYVPVPAGTILRLPHNESVTVAETTYLGDFAEQRLGNSAKARLLFDLNAEQVQAPKTLPAGAVLRLPQRNAPSLIAFAILALILFAVALFRGKPSVADAGPAPPT
jgi:putative OPT family oligopeptide transporter